MAEKMVEKVTRLMKVPANIRNIAICAHIDHGKTTFSDNLLAGAGMMSQELAGKACLLDFHEDEQQRGITIDSAAVSMVHVSKGQEFLINLIDTPGHVDFGGDVTRAMRAVDGAITLCCAVEGIMPQTETVLRQALKERVKPVLFINKVDRLIKEVKLTPEKMQAKFIDIIGNVNRLILEIAEQEFGGKWQVKVDNGSVAFGSAFHKWALSLPYMQEKKITFKDIIEAYENDKHAELAAKAPLHEVVLDMVVRHHPNPKDAQFYRIPKIWHGDPESEDGKSLMECNPNGRVAFVVTKVVIDPHAGEVSAGRLFSGTLRKGDIVTLNRMKKDVRIQQVSVYNGPKRDLVDEVPAGNIVGIVGLKDGYPGETISTNGPMEPFEAITHLFEPVITKAIEAKRPSDLPKLIEVLRQVGKEDPTIKIEINEDTGEHLMHGMGELHLEVIENRIKSEKGVEVSTTPPIVVYRETILGANAIDAEGKSPNKHNKLYFKVEPLEPVFVQAMRKGDLSMTLRVKKKEQDLWKKLEELGMDSKVSRQVRALYKGNMFIDATRGIVHMHEIIEMVLDMFEDVMDKGPLARDPCIGVKVIITDVKLHEDAIHRGPAQLYPAVREGIRDAMRAARPAMFEPVQTLQFEAPIEYTGDLSKLVGNKRGQLLEMNQEGAGVVVKAKMPVAEMFGLSSDLRSATGGRGVSFLVDQTFERLPDELQQRVITQIRARKGLTENQ